MLKYKMDMRLLNKKYKEILKKQDGLLQLEKAELELLKALGLSNEEIELYDLMLFENMPMTAQDVASKALVFPSAVYRCFYELAHLGLIKQKAVRPKSFVALSPGRALPLAVESKREGIEKILQGLKLSKQEGKASVEIIIGGQALFDRYVVELSKSRKYMDGHSVGNAYSDEMLREHILASKRGVKMRYAFQEYKHETFPILRKWQRAGLELRHYKVERGFHFMIFDNERLLISFVNPDKLDDRLSIFTDNEVAVSIFGRYFETIWYLARPVTLSEKKFAK